MMFLLKFRMLAPHTLLERAEAPSPGRALKKFQVGECHLELDVLFSFFLEELLEEVHLLLILNRTQMQSFLHNHHRWFTFLVGSPERKAIPIWIASLGKVDPVA